MSNLAHIRPVGLRTRYGLDTFFESGCYQGDSMFQAYRAGFSKVISCDINPNSVASCRAKFPNAAVLHAESTYALGPLMPQLAPWMGRTLFWLDAHFPAYYGTPENEANRFPLFEELRLIRQNKPGWEDDVIAFDDLRVIRDPANPRYRAGELAPPEDQLYIDASLDDILAPFAATHDAAMTMEAEGALVLMPKQGA